MGLVGGTPGTIAAGSEELALLSARLRGMAEGLTGAAEAAGASGGDAAFAAACHRFATVCGGHLESTGRRVAAASRLASYGAADLRIAGGS